jgi:hypothetical protein
MQEHPKHDENALRIQWGDDTWKMGMNCLKVGSADPGSALIAPPFVWVTVEGVLKVVPDVWVSWSWFARVVGP